MTENTDALASYIAERERRRKRGWRIAAALAVLVTVVGGVVFAVHASGAKQRERDNRTEEVMCAMLERDC